jgi:hypothetical protein
MTLQAVDVNLVCRRMRGGSQSHMIRASDRHCYVAKFAGNPQGTRTLINECIGHWFFRRLGVATPEIRLLQLSQRVIDRAGLHFEMGNRKVGVRPGRHFGSRCPVDPDRKAIFDLFPSACFHRVANLDDFAKALVLDRLLGQTDSRQCIFFRQPRSGKADVTFSAFMIDHGGIFGGSQWMFNDSPQPPRSLYSEAYQLIDIAPACCQAISSLREISEPELHAVIDEIPTEWFTGNDREVLTKLLSATMTRINNLEALFWPYLTAVMSYINEGMPLPQRTAGPLGAPPSRHVSMILTEGTMNC